MKIYVTDKYRIFTFALICAMIGLGTLLVKEESCNVVSVQRLLPIYCVERSDNAISITFDCAWGSDDIDSILHTLEKHNCKATFFVLGTWAEKNPDAIKKITAAGHEIGNHSYNHTYYTKLSLSEILEDIEKCNTAIEKAGAPVPILLRAPAGDYSNNVLVACERAKMKCIQWSVDSLDWRNLNCNQMLSRILPKTSGGSILLFHNDTGYTAESLDTILSNLESHGFTFLKVSDLIYQDNYTLDGTGKQIPTK